MVCFRYLIVLCFAIITIGCAGHKMALTPGQANIDLTNRSISLLALTTPFNMPNPVICPPSETCSRYPPYTHMISLFSSSVNLLSLELPEGIYKITRFVGDQGEIWSNFDIEFKSNTILYVGHLYVVKGEQGIRYNDLGRPYIACKYHYEIKDNFEEDMKLFASKYPALQNANVEISIIKTSYTPVYLPLKGYMGIPPEYWGRC